MGTTLAGVQHKNDVLISICSLKLHNQKILYPYFFLLCMP